MGTGAILGIRSLARQATVSRRLARRMDELALPAPDALREAAGRAGLAGRVVLVDSPEPFSFAYGALAPRVAISRGLLADASAGELVAVLEHERYHVHNLDPPSAPSHERWPIGGVDRDNRRMQAHQRKGRLEDGAASAGVHHARP